MTKSLLNSDFKDEQYPNAKGKNVLVIGGGDTGNDCVGTAIRHGAKSVLQLEMMSEPPLVRADSNPWPEWPLVKKTDYGQEENIAVFGEDPRVYNSTVKEFILDSKGNVKQAVIVKLQTVVKDGRRSFEQVPGSEKTVPCDLVLIAAGFIGAQKPVINAFGVELDARNTVKCDENDHHTNISKLYSAGDVRRGQSLVVWAIREGRDVAKQVDFDLMGYTGLKNIKAATVIVAAIFVCLNNAKSKRKEMHPSYFKLPLLIVPEELTFLIITLCCFLGFYITMEDMIERFISYIVFIHMRDIMMSQYLTHCKCIFYQEVPFCCHYKAWREV